VMDDIGALIWRFGRRLIVHSADPDHHAAPPAETVPARKSIVHPAAE